MTDIVLLVSCALQFASLIALIVLWRKAPRADASGLRSRLDDIEAAQRRIEHAVREEVGRNREEFGKSAKDLRLEVNTAFKDLGTSVVQRMNESANSQKQQLDAFSNQLTTFAHASGERLDAARVEAASTGMKLREEVVATLNSISETMVKTMGELGNAQKSQLEAFSSQIAALAQVTSEKMEAFSGRLGAFAQASGERLDAARAEAGDTGTKLREEVIATLKSISETMVTTMGELGNAQKSQLEALSKQTVSLTQTTGEKLDGIRKESADGAQKLREEVVQNLTAIGESATKASGELAKGQKDRLEAMSAAIANLSESNARKLEEIRVTVEGKLESIQKDNAKQLEQMRQTVDEKLQGTLEKRLGESFKQVSDRLEQVHKGLGEMQTLATGVGDLKKFLTNVKSRGTWGEVQLGALLEQVLSPNQFAKNVSTKGGGERVEFAIKMPGQGTDNDEPVWLPIDAKFPLEDYQRLVDAQERADIVGVEEAGKQLENRIKTCASDICEKYLDPPKTTDFAILFVPNEGLFAEIIRRVGLSDMTQLNSRVVIAGPTTLWSILNSFQMGFRTLAITKRSSEVWNLLGAVKTEWTKYGDVLEVVQKKLHQASDTIDNAKRRSRAVGRKLREVQELPASEANRLLPPGVMEDDAETEEGESVVA